MPVLDNSRLIQLGLHASTKLTAMPATDSNQQHDPNPIDGTLTNEQPTQPIEAMISTPAGNGNIDTTKT